MELSFLILCLIIPGGVLSNTAHITQENNVFFEKLKAVLDRGWVGPPKEDNNLGDFLVLDFIMSISFRKIIGNTLDTTSPKKNNESDFQKKTTKKLDPPPK